MALTFFGKSIQETCMASAPPMDSPEMKISPSGIRAFTASSHSGTSYLSNTPKPVHFPSDLALWRWFTIRTLYPSFKYPKALEPKSP